MEFEEVTRVLAAFERRGVRYVLVGSMAMAAQGIVRATRDMDVFISAEAENVERLKAALRELYADPQIEEIRAEELAGDYPVVQYVPPSGDYSIDILARLGEAFRFDDIESEETVLGGIRVRVATPRTLYRMKRDTLRAQDRLDAEILKERFGLAED